MAGRWSPPSTTSGIKQDVDARHKPGMTLNEWLTPFHLMPPQHFAHLPDKLVFPA
jgi:hypothetical protein